MEHRINDYSKGVGGVRQPGPLAGAAWAPLPLLRSEHKQF